jgi:hypothetical protein
MLRGFARRRNVALESPAALIGFCFCLDIDKL